MSFLFFSRTSRCAQDESTGAFVHWYEGKGRIAQPSSLETFLCRKGTFESSQIFPTNLFGSNVTVILLSSAPKMLIPMP
jgi:hypothetical protein